MGYRTPEQKRLIAKAALVFYLTGSLLYTSVLAFLFNITAPVIVGYSLLLWPMLLNPVRFDMAVLGVAVLASVMYVVWESRPVASTGGVT